MAAAALPAPWTADGGVCADAPRRAPRVTRPRRVRRIKREKEHMPLARADRPAFSTSASRFWRRLAIPRLLANARDLALVESHSCSQGMRSDGRRLFCSRRFAHLIVRARRARFRDRGVRATLVFDGRRLEAKAATEAAARARRDAALARAALRPRGGRAPAGSAERQRLERDDETAFNGATPTRAIAARVARAVEAQAENATRRDGRRRAVSRGRAARVQMLAARAALARLRRRS